MNIVGVYFSGRGNVGGYVFPNASNESRCLLLVGFTHLREHKRLDGTFVSAHTDYLHLHSNFVEQTFVKKDGAGKSMDVEGSGWI